MHTCHHLSQTSNPIHGSLTLQRLLLFPIPRLPSHHQQPLARPDLVHMPLCDILPISILPQILEFLRRLRHPERIFVQEFEAGKEELRGRGTGRTFADLVAEAEGGGEGEQRGYGEEGRAFFEGLRENSAVPPRERGVSGAEDFGCGKESMKDLEGGRGTQH